MNRNFLIPLFLLCNALVWTGCGGSSGSSTTPPVSVNTGAGVPAAIVVAAGDQQNGVPGETLSAPADVRVLDNTNMPVTNATVIFSASNGGQVFPPSVTTRSSGYARTLIRLPQTPFAKTTVTASVGNLSTTLSATTGPRLVSNYGNSTAANGRVRPDGSFVGIGLENADLHDIGIDLFSPDGTLSARLGALQQSMGLPGVFASVWSVLATPDQNLYFRGYTNLFYVLQLDKDLKLTKFIDLQNDQVNVSSLSAAMTIDAAGNLYIGMDCHNSLLDPTCVKTVYSFDPSGKYAGQFPIADPKSLATNNAGNLVALLVQSGPGPSTLVEYSPSGQLVK